MDAYERAQDRGAGLRVLVNGSMGFAYSTDLSASGLRELAAAALACARNLPPDPLHSIPQRPAAPSAAPSIYDPAVPALTGEAMIERARELEEAAYRVDRRVKRIRKAEASFTATETLILSSTGTDVLFPGTALSASIEVVAEEGGEAQAGWESDVRRFAADLDFGSIGRRAAGKALDLLGARHIGSVRAPVVLDPSVAREFLDMIRSGFSAENAQKGKSLFAGKKGSVVASDIVTVRDDGLLERGIGTAPADDEGVPLLTKTVIDRGRFVLFLHNSYTARKEGTVSTGNGIRGGFKSVPGVGVTNLFIEPGKMTPEALIASTPRGLLVNEIMGAHMANPISGDFSVGATGFWIENGTKAYPVREITIAGNIIDLLRNVDAVCSDLRFSGRLGSPTMRISELSIAGT